MIPLQSVVQFVEDANIKVLTIIVVLVTDILIVSNSITQPASAFRNVPPFGAPSPYEYCMHTFAHTQYFIAIQVLKICADALREYIA
jgi:hypothetical protein